MTGTIKTLTPRGFGFISRDGETKDLFFHSKDLTGKDKNGNDLVFDVLKVGESVTFEVAEGEKGPYASNVALA